MQQSLGWWASPILSSLSISSAYETTSTKFISISVCPYVHRSHRTDAQMRIHSVRANKPAFYNSCFLKSITFSSTTRSHISIWDSVLNKPNGTNFPFVTAGLLHLMQHHCCMKIFLHILPCHKSTSRPNRNGLLPCIPVPIILLRTHQKPRKPTKHASIYEIDLHTTCKTLHRVTSISSTPRRQAGLSLRLMPGMPHSAVVPCSHILHGIMSSESMECDPEDPIFLFLAGYQSMVFRTRPNGKMICSNRVLLLEALNIMT